MGWLWEGLKWQISDGFEVEEDIALDKLSMCQVEDSVEERRFAFFFVLTLIVPLLCFSPAASTQL